ncbi:MAG: hypothetical protein GY941_16030 [Planctomycetes bacterium]|nr:hypothetical protein [Planctomycetota bacterium]
MSTGTKIVQNALKQIGAFSPVKPTNPESLEDVKDLLNSMLARWQDEGIETGAVPLDAIGDEFSEPMGLYNTFVFNLAIEAQPLFPSGTISPELRASANETYNQMKKLYQTFTIPKKVARSTLARGQGNFGLSTFYSEGEEIG